MIENYENPADEAPAIPFHCIGLTGGVGAGKSTVGAMLRAAGITVIDMDRLGREILSQDPEVGEFLRGELGEGVFTDGKPDRGKIRQVVFAAPELRKKLEAFLHPRIRERFENEAREAAQRGERFVICEAALLIETGRYQTLDGLIVVLASEKTRLARLTARDRIPETLARQILAAQGNDESRRRAATEILTNEGTLAELETQVAALIATWRKNEWLGR